MQKKSVFEKAVGSQRKQIVYQLLGESVMITLLAFVLAVCGVTVILPYFNQLAEKSLVLELKHVQWSIWLSFMVGAIIIGLLAGSYPAFYLSSFNPVQGIKRHY